MTTSKQSIAWAKKAYKKLKDRKNNKFRSGLEKQIGDLLTELGISYEYESTKISYTLSLIHI